MFCNTIGSQNGIKWDNLQNSNQWVGNHYFHHPKKLGYPSTPIFRPKRTTSRTSRTSCHNLHSMAPPEPGSGIAGPSSGSPASGSRACLGEPAAPPVIHDKHGFPVCSKWGVHGFSISTSGVSLLSSHAERFGHDWVWHSETKLRKLLEVLAGEGVVVDSFCWVDSWVISYPLCLCACQWHCLITGYIS